MYQGSSYQIWKYCLVMCVSCVCTNTLVLSCRTRTFSLEGCSSMRQRRIICGWGSRHQRHSSTYAVPGTWSRKRNSLYNWLQWLTSFYIVMFTYSVPLIECYLKTSLWTTHHVLQKMFRSKLRTFSWVVSKESHILVMIPYPETRTG